MRKSLKLQKETIKNLTGDKLRSIHGAVVRETSINVPCLSVNMPCETEVTCATELCGGGPTGICDTQYGTCTLTTF